MKFNFLTSNRTTHLPRCLVGKNSAYKVTLCGTHPMAKPTRPRSNNNHAKLGAKELKNPYRNSNTPHSVSAYNKRKV